VRGRGTNETASNFAQRVLPINTDYNVSV
jgi:hypothetical protein